MLFSAPMVRSILEGRKTQTRRVCKPQPHSVGDEFSTRSHGTLMIRRPGDAAWKPVPCPYGAPGDRLWVRETWYCDHYQVQRGLGGFKEVPGARDLLYYRERDTAPNGECYTGFSGETMRCPWNPAIHMPRWASRITLEVTGVRVERLQDISQADAIAEGGPPSDPTIDAVSRELGFADFSRSWYAQLWEQINGAGSWAANPWVWVVEFRRVEAARAAA